MKSIPIYRLIDKEVPFNLPRSIILMTFLDTVRDTHQSPSENPLPVLRVSLLHTKSDCERLHLAKEQRYEAPLYLAAAIERGRQMTIEQE